MLMAIESGKAFTADSRAPLLELFNYVPDDFNVHSVIAVPMPIGDRIGGVVLPGPKRAGFRAGDPRPGATPTPPAGGRRPPPPPLRPLRHGEPPHSPMTTAV